MMRHPAVTDLPHAKHWNVLKFNGDSATFVALLSALSCGRISPSGRVVE